jgi:PPOX class probable FMN-dependent enzyme
MARGTVGDHAALKVIYGEPSELARRKVLSRLDRHCRDFISLSPFLVIGTASATGPADVSPRGDAPGFVAIIDDKTLLIPDRPGNKRNDTLSNILENPQVALIFFVPGMNETLRVNGRAQITDDESLLGPLSVRGKLPLSGILVEVEAAFLHCAKALIRSRLWAPESQIDRKSFPSLGKMISDQIEGLDRDAVDAQIAESIEKRLY